MHKRQSIPLCPGTHMTAKDGSACQGLLRTEGQGAAGQAACLEDSEPQPSPLACKSPSRGHCPLSSAGGGATSLCSCCPSGHWIVCKSCRLTGIPTCPSFPEALSLLLPSHLACSVSSLGLPFLLARVFPSLVALFFSDSTVTSGSLDHTCLLAQPLCPGALTSPTCLTPHPHPHYVCSWFGGVEVSPGAGSCAV